jgi:hypothetical protein
MQAAARVKVQNALHSCRHYAHLCIQQPGAQLNGAVDKDLHRQGAAGARKAEAVG